jgi:esterase FrsA
MANAVSPFGARPLEEVKRELLGRAKANRNPFLYTRYEEVAPVIHALRSVNREEWARAFSTLAHPHEQRAAQAEAAGDVTQARAEYLIAYDCYHVARYPAPNSPGKLGAYRKSQENFHKAARYFDPPLERVEMAFRGRAGEGAVSIGLLRKPKNIVKPPLVVIWGGIDAFKEE